MKADSLTKWLEKYAIFMTNTAKTNFIINQQTARGEFLTSCNIKNGKWVLELMSKQNEFLEWLKTPKTLKRLGYASETTNIHKVHSAYEEAIMDYKRAVMYFTGSKL